MDLENLQHLPSVDEKPWHTEVSSDLRNHLVKKLITSIYPNSNNRISSNMQPQAMRRLVQFAKKVEHEMYEQAGSKDDYYHRLAEKIYKIHKELEQRNKDRETERLRAENGGADKGSTGEEATQPSDTVGDTGWFS